ncbi:MAG: hypothetical protein R2828_10760 [Saprospiraceae bacterium]
MEDLFARIKKIESLIKGSTTAGEKTAALLAKERILEKYPRLKHENDLKEYALYTQDNWHKKLLIAICRKYEVKPYRYHRQKYTTVMVRINPEFLNNVLWPEFLEYSAHLESIVEGITDDLINKIHAHEEEDIIHGNLE